MGFDISFGGAVVAGLLSFLSPCILPIVPFYLCYMVGLTAENIKADLENDHKLHIRLITASIFFALGVTTIFVLLGMGATATGQIFRTWQEELSYVAALILLTFGIHFLGLLRIPLLYREARLTVKQNNPTTFIGSYIMGLAFGFGWTPCVGPALASILILAAGEDSIRHGALLLFVYGASMTFPFILAAIFAKPFLEWAKKSTRLLNIFEKLMGLMLIVFSLLIFTNSVSYIANFLLIYFPTFASIG